MAVRHVHCSCQTEPGATATTGDVAVCNILSRLECLQDDRNRGPQWAANGPVGKALIGHRLDDEVQIEVPSGTRIYEIVDINYE